jgi:DNA polymerase III subunit delta
MKLQGHQLRAHLKNNLASCYLVSGDEHLLVDEALDAIRSAARERGFNARELHVATAGFDWAQLGSAAANLSLFADQRIVELRLPTGKPGRVGGQAIQDFVAQLGPELLLVVVTPKLERATASTKWVKALEERGVGVTVWPVSTRDLPGWIADRMRRAGLEPERQAIALVAERVEGNLLAAAQEIEKLRLLLGPGKLTADAVSEAVANSSRFDVYKLADAALAGDARRALRILAGLRAEGVEPVIVVWSLTRELRTLARLADLVRQRTDLGSAMQKARVWRSRQGLMRSALGRQTPGALFALLRATGRADAAAKGQRQEDPWQLAAEIVLELATGGQRAA